MKYLSDLLYVDVPTSSFKGQNKTYTVYMRYLDVAYGDTADYIYIDKAIYTGNIYGTGSVMRIYLNDIISTYAYDNSYVYEHKDSKDSVIYEAPVGMLFEINVTVTGIGTYSVTTGGELIMNCYRDSKMIPCQLFREDLEADFPENINNLLLQRTTMLPRIPRLHYATSKFWFSNMFVANLGWIRMNTDGGTTIFSVMGSNNGKLTGGSIVNDMNSFVNAFTIKGSTYYDIVKDADTLHVGGINVSLNAYSSMPVANIDICPSEYYLIWIDRTGQYQCQPFNGKNTLSENVTAEYRTDRTDKNIVASKSITNKWSLNTGWLSEDDYKAFESIFASKYLYLFNTECNEGHEVLLETGNWSEKTKKNKDKMYNLSISVKAARPQNIAY